MTPSTVLVVLLTIVALRPFFETPEAMKRAAAQQRGGYTPNPSRAFAYALLAPVTLTLWWWYALTTGQMLLGVIPTVGFVSTVVVVSVERAAAKKAQA